MQQGNCSAGDNFSFFAPENEFDCANRIKLKVCQCVNRRPIVPSLRCFCAFATSLTSRVKNEIDGTTRGWVGIVKRTFSRTLVMRRSEALGCGSDRRAISSPNISISLLCARLALARQSIFVALQLENRKIK